RRAARARGAARGGQLMGVPLTIATSDYDHVRDFASGLVRAEGIDVTYLTLTIEEIFFRFIKFREWHVSEISMGKYVSLVSPKAAPLVPIPVFPSRIRGQSWI